MNREGGIKDNMRIYFLTARLASWHNLCNPAFSREDHIKKSRGSSADVQKALFMDLPSLVMFCRLARIMSC